jgi:hypothetical protein
MNARILIFGTLFLLGNITLGAQELNREGMSFSEDNRHSFVRKGVRDELEERLIERGLDNAIAEDLAKNTFEDNDILESIKIHNYLTAVQGIEYDSLMDQLVTRTLFKKTSDFSDYDTLVGLTREIVKGIIEDTTLEKLSKVAMINQNLKTIG